MFSEVRTQALAHAIDAKSAELSFLEGRLKPETYVEKMLKDIKDIFEQQIRFHRGENFSQGSQDAEMSGISTGEKTNFKKVGLSWIQADYDLAREDVIKLAARVVEIIRSRDIASLQKALAKLEVKNRATPSASEAAESLKTLNDSIDKRVKELVLQALAKGPAKKQVSRRNSSKPKSQGKEKTGSKRKASSQATNGRVQKKLKTR
ncbi:hypothetical protein Trco_008530 [Trichoderma cornu-damae]|uniref:Uncharacterized protein n=1 Tax=Trichoderma cornu-damae TaxID=654480 RepID=A0A9P8QEP4_9HYPO|nr:hypothetical protein Trco_008528 [Trichoderma cornu-damae]KAH6603115.1 hypothetical protein Trco_008530 [Trichoderma cornu-damae]